jgi:3',5'-cyclic AMP phosphodiesterase CpdA
MSEPTFYITSDLHYGANKRGDLATARLAQHALEHPADALLIGGDIGEGVENIARCLALFQGFEGLKLAVPGNHDVWTKDEDHAPHDASWTLHEEVLPQVFAQHGFHPLHLSPARLGGLVFVGSMGWYDYSFRDDIGIDLPHYQSKTPPWSLWPIWNDARYARFPFDDPALVELLHERLRAQLDHLDPAAQVVALVHHVVTKELLVHPRWMVPKEWRYANAFLGAERLGELLTGDPRVSQVFCGHIHRAKTVHRGACALTTVGGDYKQKQLLRATPAKLLEALLFDPTGV